MSIASNIRSIRKSKAITQEQLAKKSGISVNTISCIERGEYASVSARSLRAIAEALEVAPDVLYEELEKEFCVVLDELAYMPTKAHNADAGYDLYSPKHDLIPRKGSSVIDTGVHIAIPNGYAGVLMSKSGLNVKYGLTSEGLIDSDYTGSIKVKLYNNSDTSYEVRPGDKISQIVFIPVASPKLLRVEELPTTERGDGGFGSTGR